MEARGDGADAAAAAGGMRLGGSGGGDVCGSSTRSWDRGGGCAGETGFGGEEGGDAVEGVVGYDALLEKGF